MTRKQTTFAFIGTLALAPGLFMAQIPNTGSAADNAFVAQVSQGGGYEVAASNLALERATAWDVKDLAAAESHDHTGVNLRLKTACQRAGIPMAKELNAEFTERLAKLNAVKDADFDAAYIADMQQIHDKDEKLFAAEAQNGTGNMKAFAHDSDLIVKRHIGALHGLDH